MEMEMKKKGGIRLEFSNENDNVSRGSSSPPRVTRPCTSGRKQNKTKPKIGAERERGIKGGGDMEK